MPVRYLIPTLLFVGLSYTALKLGYNPQPEKPEDMLKKLDDNSNSNSNSNHNPQPMNS